MGLVNGSRTEPHCASSRLPAADWRVFYDRLRRVRQGDELFTARDPCPKCATTDAILTVIGNQATVRCALCQRHLYNAPRTETGARRRTVKTLRTWIRPAQQARVVNRDRGRCVLCSTSDDLTIGHLLSIEHGALLGASAHELNSDANLATMCEACNLGLLHGPKSVSPRMYAVLMWRLAQIEHRDDRDDQTALPLG